MRAAGATNVPRLREPSTDGNTNHHADERTVPVASTGMFGPAPLAGSVLGLARALLGAVVHIMWTTMWTTSTED